MGWEASLLQLATRQGHPFSFVMPQLDATMITMLCCLLGVPMVTATVAFLLVEASMRAPQLPMERIPEPRLPPHPASAAAGGWRSQPFGTRPSLTRPATPQVPPSTAVSLPPSRTLSMSPTMEDIPRARPGSMSALTEPPTLPELAVPPSSVNVSIGSGFGPQPRPLVEEAPEEEQDAASARISPLSTALLVKSPAGVLVKLDGTLQPHPERRSVNIVSVKDGSPILCAHVEETDGGHASGSTACIRVETKAKSIPIAMLDTRGAIFPVGMAPPPMGQRRVVLHRVGGDGGAAVGPACAWISPAPGGRFLVSYLIGEPGRGLTVDTRPGGILPIIERMVDGQGQVVAKADSFEATSDAQPALWVRQGVDMALISCVALAVQKLSRGP